MKGKLIGKYRVKIALGFARLLLVLVTLAYCLSACTADPSPARVLTTQVVTTTATVTSTRNPSATQTLLPKLTATPRRLDLPTIPLIPTSTIITKEMPICLGEGISSDFPYGLGISGIIVYQNIEGQGLYTIGGMPLIHSKLPVENTQETEVFGFSPNEEWLAFAPVTGESTAMVLPEPGGVLTTSGTLAFDTPTLVLLSGSGARTERVLDKEGIEVDLPLDTLNKALGWPDSYWINDKLIFVDLYFWDLDPYSNGSLRQIILDPFQGSWVEEPLLGLEDRYKDGNVGFSPDMTEVLYETQTGDHYSGILLRDLITNDVLWSDSGLNFDDNTIIRWSPDSSRVAVGFVDIDSRSQHVYIISREGEARIIADSTLPSSGFNLSSLSWSPDSRYLAMVNSTYPFQMYIYDLSLDEYIYYCPLITYDILPPDPVWSPDSSYIALVSPQLHKPIQILNLQTGEINNLNVDGVVVGWSDKFPTSWP